MAEYTVQTVAQAGVVPTENAVSASDTFNNQDGNVILEVTNGSGGQITVTVVSQATVSSLAVADQTVTIDNGAVKAIGPFKTSVFNDASDDVTVTYSGTSSVTAQCLKIVTQG